MGSWRHQQSQWYLFHNPWMPSPGSNHHLLLHLVPEQSFAQPTTPTRPWMKHSRQPSQRKLTKTISAQGKNWSKFEKKLFNWIHFRGAFKLSRDISGLSIPPSLELGNNPWENAIRIHNGLDFVWCKMSCTCFYYCIKDLALWMKFWLGLITVAIRTLL